MAVDVPPGAMRTGCNEVAVWCNVDLRDTPAPTIVHDLLVEAAY